MSWQNSKTRGLRAGDVCSTHSNDFQHYNAKNNTMLEVLCVIECARRALNITCSDNDFQRYNTTNDTMLEALCVIELVVLLHVPHICILILVILLSRHEITITQLPYKPP